MGWNDRTHQQSIIKWCFPIKVYGDMCRFMDLIESLFPVVCCPICTGKFSSNVNFFIPVMPMNIYKNECI